MSDADLLRRAATLVRETARAAPRGPYTVDTKRTPDDTRILFADDGDAFAVATDWASGHGHDTGTPEQTGAHIALWHPGVALAVAAWLESVADLHEPPNRPPGCQWCTDEDWPCADTRHALTVARLLLGEDSE